ncbi:uncharacterized protein Z518_01880 [Rhinocladiella mackenziei CBS 650.93]|uniref:MJ1316 RNA cyclic group end recognition domain-containing protein n=1 Tax=Rhinocladiella mackenziei CBS 650.93 TaxID=1442369 RepID=A0A0D2FY53_9EURO|nr:uncharacterized protein Z518_01880 [Rhinocladiella mackenziei CBS 650.93]KIX07227.1 hypothetical protein Z518_01880 [Rhinocladiella mackenziei CBS 650.93]
MAETHGGKGPNPDSRLEEVNHLRSVAENHLKEIDEEKQQEEEDESRRIEELERYAKHRRRGKEGPSLGSTPTPKMRSAQDVLSRLQWDDQLDITKFTIGYLERFAGIKEMQASTWISEFTEEEWIPQHRIKYFKRINENGNHEVVWDRDKRIDKVFGSGLSSLDGVDIRSEDGGVGLMP